MPKTLRLPDGGYMRRVDINSIVQFLYAMDCVQLVGFSNVGKSALMRLLAQPDVWIQELGEAGQEFRAIYVDCNRMLEMGDQGFYELVLRCLQETDPDLAQLPAFNAAYDMLVAPASEFQIPLAFSRGVTIALQQTSQKIIFLFDEFDEPFAQIDSRVFLNLRALRDRHSAKLAYVTATVQPLRGHGTNDHSSEFCELFSHRSWYLAPLTRSDVERQIHRYMDAFETRFSPADVDFVYQWSGGHPPMVDAVCRALDRVAATVSSQANLLSAEPAERWDFHREVTRSLRTDENLQLECIKIWRGRTEAERQALAALFQPDVEPDAQALAHLRRMHILNQAEGQYQIFGRALASFIERLVMQQQQGQSTLWVDVDSGDVIVDEEPVEPLTNLEYRLMLLLFRHVGKIVDKFQIVTEVWGENYIDEVDDTRIEKLISRLRQKIEPDSGAPRFLTTVRGRGYRLVLNGEEA